MRDNVSTTGAQHFLRKVLAPAVLACFDSRRDNVLLLIVVAAGLALRLLFIGQPMRADESTTFMLYANGSLASALTYLSPNNHVLHTLLVKAATAVFGGSPAAIRLPALAFGSMAIVLVFCCCRRLGSSGLAAAAILATSPYFVLFSTNARGYTLLVCLVLLLLIISELFIRRPTAGGATIFAMVAALGMLTMPTMAFALAGIFLWIGWCTIGRASTRTAGALTQLLGCGLKSIAFTLLLYAATIWLSGFQALLGNEFVQSQDFREFIAGLRWHIEGTAVQFVRDMPWWALAFLAIACVGGVRNGLQDTGARVVSLSVCLLAGAGALLLANHRIPFERTWIYLIPLAAILIDNGMSRAMHWSNGLGRCIAIAAFLLSMLLPAVRVAQGSVLTYDDTGLYLDGPAVGELLANNMSEGDALVVPCCQNYSVFYYLWRFGAPAYFYGTRAGRDRAFYVVPEGVPASKVLGEDQQAKLWRKAGSTTIFVSEANAR